MFPSSLSATATTPAVSFSFPLYPEGVDVASQFHKGLVTVKKTGGGGAIETA